MHSVGSCKLMYVLCLFALLAAGKATAAGSMEAGQMVWVSGQVSAQAASGQTRSLKRGDDVSSGDTVQTGDGRGKIRFTDNGIVTLLPQTRLRIAEYRFSRADTDSSRLDLQAGGIRAVSGEMTRERKQAFLLTTPSGHIGIRGTTFDVRHCEADCRQTGVGRPFPAGTYARVSEGAVILKNPAGELVLERGQTGYFRDNKTAPRQVARFPDEGYHDEPVPGSGSPPAEHRPTLPPDRMPPPVIPGPGNLPGTPGTIN